MPVQTRTRIREYELLEQVGRGGMGAVFKARHIYLNKIRAIKIIHAALTIESDFSERFIREARILSELNHPNLVRLYEFGTLEQGNFFMVMEFVHGESLMARIRRRGRLSIEEAVNLCHDAALGLHSAHQLGIVHRDISPDNILLVRDSRGDEVVKVIDFGIAKAIAESQRFTATHMFIGKPEYCSPEQTGFLEDTPVDHRSDIYSLAVNFYQMISGKLPFTSSTPQGYLLKHANEAPVPILRHFNEGEVPPELDAVMNQALAKHPSKRYSSMLEFAEELKRVAGAAGKLESTIALNNPAQKFQEFFDLGKHRFDQLEWTEAIRWWTKARAISEDPALEGWISAAKHRLQLENEVRTAISRELEECEIEAYQGNAARAAQLLNHVEQSLSSDLNLMDLHTRVATLRENLVQRPSQPTPSGKGISGIAIALIAAGFLMLSTVLVIAFYVVPKWKADKAQEERLQIEREIRLDAKENRLREARRKLLLLKEQGMDSSDPVYRELELLLSSGSQEQAQTLYKEAEISFSQTNTDVAYQKLKELEELNVPGYEEQIKSLRGRIKDYLDYWKVSESTRTPLMRQIILGDVQRARQMMDQGHDINAADGNGYTVLMYAIWKTPELVADLLLRKVNVAARDNKGVTALHVAADVGHLGSAQLLIDFGAQLNALNYWGATPLMVAATRGRTQIAQLLIDRGADVTLKAPDGYDALSTAEYYNHTDIVELIRAKLRK